MLSNDIHYELNVYYQEKLYSWNKLSQKLNKLPIESQGIISSQRRFSTVLNLLYGFLHKSPVFPASSDFIELSSPFFGRETEELALAIATSGSQSKAKIALLSRGNIISHCHSFIKQVPIEVSSVWLNCLPLNHIAGVMIIYRCWFNNATMLLHDDFNVQKVWHDIHHFSVTHISLVPRMLSLLLEHSRDSCVPDHLKYIIVGGDKLSEQLFHRAQAAGWPIYISYGMTEACSTIALGLSANKLIPLDDFEIGIAADDVLSIKGPGVFTGYADSTAEKIENGWFETNDRVLWDGHFLSIQGRNDNMIISGGNNITPEYIESLLLRSEFVTDIAIGKINNSEWGDTIVALLCGDMDKIKTWVKQEIKSTYQPRVFIHVQQIPRNLMGKIDRKAVQLLISEQSELNNYF